jgi:phosphoribosylformimino-5-aminoimidazole carboxamide ribotide isomerase
VTGLSEEIDMIVIPTIELQKGHCVTLNRGRLDEPELWHVDPVQRAVEFAAAGAEWLHLTDLDAASGDGSNEAIIEEIILKVGIPCQLAGGYRTLDHVAAGLDKGAGRIVIGSAAVRDPDFVKEAAKLHPDQIVLSIDVYQGHVVVNGWRDATVFEPVNFAREFEGAPLAAIVVTDIDAYAGDSDGSVGLISMVADAVRSPVIASGIVRSLDDISRLKYVRNIAGALVGHALFSKMFELEEAIAIARRDPEERWPT